MAASVCADSENLIAALRAQELVGSPHQQQRGVDIRAGILLKSRQIRKVIATYVGEQGVSSASTSREN